MSSFSAFNILNLVKAIGEKNVQDILSDFSCEKNLEIELFVREKALGFAKKKVSITYLVLDDRKKLAAIFTLTHKSVQISHNGLSRTTCKKMQRYAQFDESTESYSISAFLIAQLGKNSAYSGLSISGDELMKMALVVLRKVQQEIGGGVVYLECEEKEVLLSFYQNDNNGFRIFDDRFSIVDNTKFIQLFKFF